MRINHCLNDFLLIILIDGSSVNVWNDSWLRDYNNMKVITSVFEGLEDGKVIDLMIPNCRHWDMELLHDIFDERDIKEISSIPLTSHIEGDTHV